MDDFEKKQVLQWYQWVEDELLDLINYIPPIGDNLNVFSPKLAHVIIESCGLLDSVLRQISPDPVAVDGKNKPRKNLDIVDYAKLYASTYALPTCKSILLITPPKYLIPFSAWRNLTAGGKYQSTLWWLTHTKLKHDRIANLKEARLELAIDSLCGLHLIIATLPEFARAVLAHGWVPGNKPSPQLVIDTLEGKTSGPSQLVESKLFVVARGRKEFPDKIEDFHPLEHSASDRIYDIFGRDF